MSKDYKSKLDPFTTSLDEWFGLQKLTLEAVQAKLKEDGCAVSLSRLSRWWEARQSTLQQEKLLQQIATGARQCKELREAFGEHAAPELETIMSLHRVLIMQLSTQGAANPALLEMADRLTRTLLSFISGRTKADHKERELAIAEARLLIDSDKYFDALLKKAAELNDSGLSQADRIKAMREAAFSEVDALQQSGKVQIPT